MLVDGQVTILGLPERHGLEEPPGRVIKYTQRHLATVQGEVKRLWNSQTSLDYDSYLRQMIVEVVTNNPTISDELLASILRLPIEELKANEAPQDKKGLLD